MSHELVHLLDLCILSYQLHNQTLIWPMDPYYEQMHSPTGRKLRRANFMAKVHELNHAKLKAFSLGTHGPLGDHRIPQASNRGLDPIISDYTQIDPMRPSAVRPLREEEKWTLYNAPEDITRRIVDLQMVGYDKSQAYDLTQPFPGVVLAPVPVPRPGAAAYVNPNPIAGAADWLYCFEGGTGRILKSNNQPSFSIMGFVLARVDETDPTIYDIYIVFRGSRSGDPRFLTALRTGRGNPDWVTDMDFGLRRGEEAARGRKLPYISPVGNVAPGFAESVKTMLPTIMECLRAIHYKKQASPRTIYVTGHSLGAALAVHFTSAVLMGYPFGYKLTAADGVLAPNQMPWQVTRWPWKSTQLVPFALPVVGGDEFHQAFNITLASRRVHIPGDPVTQTVTRYPVGNSYMIAPRDSDGKRLKRYAASNVVNAKAFAAHHEPYNIRKYLIRDLQAKRLLIRGDQTANDIEARTLSDQNPWETFFDFKELIQSRIAKNAPGHVGEMFPHMFSQRLTEYLDVLFEVLTGHAEKNSINDLKAQIANPTLPLQVIYDMCSPVYEPTFHKFLGLCIFLNHVQAGTYANARAQALTPPFVNLPLR
jgi:hypothetical protein